MKMKSFLMGGIAVAMLALAPVQAQNMAVPNAAIPAMPAQTTRTGKHINRIIDMWLQNKPVFYAQIEAGGFGDGKGETAYDMGKRMSATKADYITWEMEHGALDFHELREFMRGLVDGGTTRTGHRTPAVIATLPIQGTPDAVRANVWMIQQTLAT